MVSARASSALPVVADYKAVKPENREGMPRVELDAVHSPFKALSHPELLRAFVEGQEIRPIHMRIGLTGACNMRCNFCNFHSPNESNFYDRFSFKDALATDAAIALLREFAESGGRAATICGSGENTVHPGYAEICRAAHAAGLRIGLITNGALLHREDIARCVIDTHTWVRIGMNAGTAETFSQITNAKPEVFPRMLGSIRALREGAVDPDFRIGLNFVITLENYREIAEAVRLAKESGAHYLRMEPEFYSSMGHETIFSRIDEIIEVLERVSEERTETFEVSIPKLDRGPMDQTEAVEGDFHRCHYSRFVTAVGADGELYPCPQVHLNERYRIGNVVEKGYLNVLEGGDRRAWESSNPLRTDLCKTCFYRPQNELLEWLKDGRIQLDKALSDYRVEVPETLHGEFI